VYVICSVYTGQTGLSAYKQLRIEQQKLQANTESLAHLNKDLENSRDALVDDADTITMYARDLGYGYRDERFIRIVGMGNMPKQRTAPGQIMLAIKPAYTSNSIIFFFAFCITLGVFFCILIPDFLKWKRVKPPVRKRKVNIKEQWHSFWR
jgi:hypothetical protein